MFCRTFATLMLTLGLLGALSGCDNSPKYVLPDSQVPPAPKPVAAGGGEAPAKPVPEVEPKEKLPNPKELPADATPPPV